jgi:hypothetical protein
LGWFFAVTATIFLAGKDSAHEPFTRAKLKEQMPGYFNYLVGSIRMPRPSRRLLPPTDDDTPRPHPRATASPLSLEEHRASDASRRMAADDVGASCHPSRRPALPGSSG